VKTFLVRPDRVGHEHCAAVTVGQPGNRGRRLRRLGLDGRCKYESCCEDQADEEYSGHAASWARRNEADMILVNFSAIIG